ncbi:MAG: cyclic nucleotide-binding domain-containing protein [Planctomycetaceae bacterium]|nr:cyclic nucleotide-binding domain-containing protein [Planctomycetaceae bacterium]
MEIAVTRPQRWDVPFGEPLRDDEVDRLLSVEPFAAIDAAIFPASLPLREILRNDARLQHYAPGDIIVREGDYGSSAFFILSGRVRVVLAGLSPEVLGRKEQKRIGWLAAMVQSLTRSRVAEVRSVVKSPVVSNAVTAERGDPEHPHIFLQDVPRVLEATDTVVLEPGEMFGELAALTRSPRTATVFAEKEATLLEIRWQGLRDLMRRTDALRQHVERLYRQNSLLVHLRETPLLADLPADKLALVAAATRFESHGSFDWNESYATTVKRRPGDAIVDEPLIAEEGTPADGLILIRSGFARQSRRYGNGHRTAAYLGRGASFGLAEAVAAAGSGLPTNWNDSLRAVGYVDVLRIPQEVLEEAVFPSVTPEALAAAVKRQSTYAVPISELPSNGADESFGLDQSLLEFLVDHRLLNGQEAMAINLDRCTRCDDCVRACAATHDNNPRFVRQGHRHGPLMIAQACMHCVDPVCMIGCPTGAIGRDGVSGVVQINDRTCIGCSTCANSCPYDNIQMVEVRDGSGALLLDAATQQPIAKATKCDLCSGLPGGPACQRACPHDALVRLDLGNLGELAAFVTR